jgi:hypothetical protein
MYDGLPAGFDRWLTTPPDDEYDDELPECPEPDPDDDYLWTEYLHRREIARAYLRAEAGE